jgi:ABC-2 type transport system permease protein
VVGVLIGLRGTLLRRSFSGTQGFALGFGALCGLTGAAGMFWHAVRYDVAHSGDLLALALAGTLVGWLVGPVVGGGDPGIRGEHLALLPVRRGRLVLGLLGAALVGVGPLTTLVGLAALVAYGARLGPAAALVGVPGAILLTVLLVVLARVVVTALGVVLGGRIRAVLAALPWAVLTAAMAQCWVVFLALGGGTNPLGAGVPASVARVLRILPSGWPLVAVEAAGRGAGLPAVGALAGLAGLIVVAVLGWAGLLDRPATAPVTHLRRRLPLSRPARTGGSAFGAVVRKELRTWWRDLVRIHYLGFALTYGLVFVSMPLLVGLSDLLPLAGLVAATMLVSCSAHLYSSDGTGLWLTLMVPGAERADVRGRQVAWLLHAAPVAVLFTLAGLVGAVHWWTLPWVTALLPVVLGGGAGLIVLVSVLVPVRMADPHRRGGNPGSDGGPIGGLIWLTLGLLAVVSAPTTALLWYGVRAGSPTLLWSATPVGVASGVLLAWGLGRLAHRRLARRGPELLARLGQA